MDQSALAAKATFRRLAHLIARVRALARAGVGLRSFARARAPQRASAGL